MSIENPVILCADGDPDMRMIITLALSMDPTLLLVTAKDGREVLDLISGGLAPDLLLLDMQMAHPSGPETAAAIRSDHRYGTPLTIFLTDTDLPEAKLLRETGAIALIRKPFDPLTLAAELRRHLDEARDRI